MPPISESQITDPARRLVSSSLTSAWLGTDSEVCQAVDKYSRDCLRTYETDERRVREDANIERTAIEGGYARRQLFELIQNGADELILERGRIEVVLTGDAMYCANEGRPVSSHGVGTLLASNLSSKTGLEIGRFGLGFKSVLGISTKPTVFSMTGSFRFDRDYNLARVRDLYPGTERVATLRIGIPLDPRQAAQNDDILAELMAWATTVVKMPLDKSRDTSWLSEHIAGFPAQFLLFSEHISELVLDDRTTELRREVELDQLGGDRWLLRERGGAARESEWRVFSTTHEPTRAVKDDGGTMADRDLVPVQWAVPVNAGRTSPGEFWAFFPTLERTTLSGVLNAPWKLNEDRTRLIEGPFNAELLTQIIKLVAAGLPQAGTSDDPGGVLELLPGREKEQRGWADLQLIEATYQALGTKDCLPDLDGTFGPPAQLRLHPEGVPFEAIRLWASETAPRDWVHPSAYRSDTRSSRVARLAEVAGTRPATVGAWLEALVGPRLDAKGSAAAVRVAAALTNSDVRDEIRRAKILLTQSGALVPANRGTVFLPTEDDVDVEVPLVDPAVLAEPGVLDALDTLRIAVVSADTVLDGLLDRTVGSDADGNWSRIWELAAKVSPERTRDLFLNTHGLDANDVRVKTLGGIWAPLATLLLPGELLAVEDFKAGHRAALVDVGYHRRDLELLRALGATDRPAPDGGSVDEPWVDTYRKQLAIRAAKEARDHGARSREAHFVFDRPPSFAGPAGVLDALTESAAVKYARELLAATPDLSPWRLVRENGKGAPQEIEHPLVWRVREMGVLPTNRGIQPIAHTISEHLKEFTDLLPVADVPRSVSRAFGLPDTVSELDPQRIAVALRSIEEIERGELLGPAYVRLARVLDDPPARLRAWVRNEVQWAPRQSVCAAVTIEDAKILRGTGAPFLRLPDQEAADELVGRWGLASVADAVSSRLLFSAIGPAEPLTDLFPMLRDVLGPRVERLSVVPCRDVERELFTETGSVTEPKDLELQDDVVYRSTRLDDGQFVKRLAERFGEPLEDQEVRQILEQAHDANVEALLKRVREQPDDASKLLELFGADSIKSRIPRELIDAVEEYDGELDDRGVAHLAINVFGVEVLKHLKDLLGDKGVQPPATWTGARPTVRFVTQDLGLDRKYAGFAEPVPPREVLVPGPSSLPDLHEFQRRSASAIRDLIVGDGGKRGLLSLPTGAGKTRVTVQALTEAIVAGELFSPVLWIAHTMELCEQAVQTWAEVWGAIGTTDGQSLQISRLWDTYAADAREDDGPQVVVATIQKLDSACVDNPQYDWLRESVSCVVVDEAHTSISPTHTRLLRWLEMDAGKERVPLIGLSATPFRGRNEEDTQRLVNRFGRRRLDKDAFDEEASIPLLQREGILAQVDHVVLDGSEAVPISESERRDFDTFKDLPSTVLTKIGADADRTNRLVEHIMSLDDDWPVLLFAASVAHAKTVAALLERRGRTAASISSADTPTGVRRYLIREFRDGRLRTLTNFGVLTQGFDAPSVRALYIARPTYSPSLYQQMVGRGLRGPKNHGKERCLVVDVSDNVDLYGHQLAFNDFEYLWTA